MLSALLFALLLRGAAAQAGPDLKLMECNAGAAEFQAWDLTGPNLEIRLVSNLNACIDVNNYDTTPGAEVYTYTPCHPTDPDPTHQNEQWKFASPGTIVQPMSGLCLTTASAAQQQQYGGISIWNCNGQAYQNWYYNKTDSTLRPTARPDLCLDGGSPGPRSCDILPGMALPYCNMSLDFETRVADLISRLTPTEKVLLFDEAAEAVPRVGLAPYFWWSEALHGVGISGGVHFGGPTPNATSFPQVIHTGATFNKTLWSTIASAISDEARVMNNVGRAGLSYWAPNINGIPDPRWGRGHETPGEDPYATGVYATNFITGLQVGEDNRYLKVSSCPKHFFNYNLESWGGMDRHHFDAHASDRDLADSYLPMFEAAVRYGAASGLMCSYNAVNGVPSCANHDLMTVIARESWGFDGYVTGDCDAVDDVMNTHHYYNTTSSTCNGVLTAGLDNDCGAFFATNLLNAFNDGSVSNDTLDVALHHMFMVQMRLGLFDDKAQQIYTAYGLDKIDTPANQQLALEAAQQGHVLLMNTNHRLPLDPRKVGNVAVIGPNLDATLTLLGNYYGVPPYIISPISGIASYVKNLTAVKGCQDVACGDSSQFADAVRAAMAADVVIVIVGLDQGQETEGLDRVSLALPGNQGFLVDLMASAAKAPIIVVNIGGCAVDFSGIVNNSKIGALVWSGYSGQSGGQALADVLFGTYNPSGRMPYTLYSNDFISQADMLDRHMRPNTSAVGRPGRTYRFYTGKPVFEYGAGLSYTTFEYSNSTQQKIAVPVEAVLEYVESIEGKHRYFRQNAPVLDYVNITVKNTGSVAGADVVQCFISSPQPGEAGNPIKEQIGFEKVFLQPGESVTIQFPVTAHDLSLVQDGGKRAPLAGTWLVKIHHESKVVVPVWVS